MQSRIADPDTLLMRCVSSNLRQQITLDPQRSFVAHLGRRSAAVRLCLQRVGAQAAVCSHLAVMEKTSLAEGISGYTYGPPDAANVIVLQEWWGKTPELEQQAIAISKKGGFRVLVPDLYHGSVGTDKEEASHLAENLDWQRARDEIMIAADNLRQNGKKVGATGFCQGGVLSFVAAQHAGINAAAPFYGFPQKPESKAVCQVEKIKVPLLMQFGENDSFFDADEARKVAEQIKAAGGDVEFHMYPGTSPPFALLIFPFALQSKGQPDVGHAFMTGFTAEGIANMETIGCPRPDNIQQVQEQAWARLIAFFDKHLKDSWLSSSSSRMYTCQT
jgi:carboxymethylenebutenolidase